MQPTPDKYQEQNSFVNRKREFRLTNSSAPPSDAEARFRHARTTAAAGQPVRNGSALLIAVNTHSHPSGELKPTVRDCG
jgi:hypothetical protein